MARTMVFCTRCKCEGSINDFFRVDKNNRGQRGAYICPDCNEEMNGYYTKNTERRGAETVHPFTYGMELETSASDSKARSELFEYHFLPTSDRTVDVEYKSPIMPNLKSLSHLGKVLDRLMADGHLEIDDRCGTHFHVGHKDLNADTMNYIRRFYHSLFVPLCDEMKKHPADNERFFGRGFGEWCETIDKDSSAMNHTNFINVQHDMTLEFRMPKFTSGAQYMAVAKFATRVAEIVMDTFVAHFSDDFTLEDVRKLERNWKLNFGVNSFRYMEIQQVSQTGRLDSIPFDMCKREIAKYFRLYNAQMAAKRIVKAYLKAING